MSFAINSINSKLSVVNYYALKCEVKENMVNSAQKLLVEQGASKDTIHGIL